MYPSVRTGAAIGAVTVYCGKESQHIPEKPGIAGKHNNANNNNFFIPLFRASKSIVEQPAMIPDSGLNDLRQQAGWLPFLLPVG